MYRKWTEEKSNEIVRLHKKGITHTEIATIMGIDRHAVTGKLWSIKVKNGYVVPKDSPWGGKKYPRSSSYEDIGVRLCNLCHNKFSYTSRYQRFCWTCKNNSPMIGHDGYDSYII